MMVPGSSPKPRASKRLDSYTFPEGTVVEGNLTVKAVEGREERRQRLRESFLSFLVKDLLVYLIGVALVVAAGVWSFATLTRSASSEPDRQFARSMLASLITGVLAFVFGKASK